MKEYNDNRGHIGLEYGRDAQLYFMGHKIASLAQSFGTPLYVYSADLIRSSLASLKTALGDRPHLICYSVKANSNLSIIKLMRELGCGADIVSGGELYRCLQSRLSADGIVFSGVGKSGLEIKEALEAGILLFSVESEAELMLISQIADGLGMRAKVSLRVNPSVEADTHPYISTGREHDKFGISHTKIIDLFKKASHWKGIQICGLACHIGSQILDVSAFGNASKVLASIGMQLERLGFLWEYLSLGGGLGIDYGDGKEPSVNDYVRSILNEVPLKSTKIILEPGRFLLGNAGILISQVILQKSNGGKKFYVVDAGMNDLLRPALYKSKHKILSHCILSESQRQNTSPADLVGPVCESGDFFAQNYHLPRLNAGDYVVICSAGAYGFSMSSNYNSRCRGAELLIDGNFSYLIRRREKYEDLVRLELEYSEER